MTTTDTNAELDGVAVIGMAGRFPGAQTIDEFWRNLKAGVESIARFNSSDLEPSVLEDPAARDNPDYVPARGILDGVDLFDAEFFGITPREAQILDPQQRLFLEASWEALERAGYDPETTRGSIGVFAGMSNNSYFAANLEGRRSIIDLAGALQTMMGNEKDYLATRVSYKLNLTGPSISVQTACSSSLVAVCQAVQSLLAYQCDMALAGGASITLPQKCGYLPDDGGITSPDGHCRAFSAEAGGTVFSNGLGVVVLKRLADALADGDNICAVVKGTAINNDGSGKVSFLAPSVDGHADAVTLAQAVARVDPRTVTFVEAHGTGTALGDVVEVAALTNAFRTHTADTGFCALGSLKTNIGHLDAAAGVSGLIKTVLALQHRLIPATLHFNAPDPRLSLENTPFFVNATPLEWPAGPTPRRAGVSSLGAGGTNAHVVLEEAPEHGSSDPGRSSELLVFSARTEAALEHTTSNFLDHLERTNVTLADAAYTLQIGRRRFAHRRALVCSSREDAVRALRDRSVSRVMTGDLALNDASLAFVFAGSAPVGCGRELYEQERFFRNEVDACADIVRRHIGIDLRRVLYPHQTASAETRADGVLLDAARFTVQYSLARLWMHWGLKPASVVADAANRLVAAAVSGVFGVEDALRRVANPQSRIPDIALSEPRVAMAVDGAWTTTEEALAPAFWGAIGQRDTSSASLVPEALLLTPTVLLTVAPCDDIDAIRHAAQARGGSYALVTPLRGQRRDLESMFDALAQLWMCGIDVDWASVHGSARRRVPLPTYPFERKRHWIDPPPVSEPAGHARTDQKAIDHGAISAAEEGIDVARRLSRLLSELSGLPEDQLSPTKSFIELGCDSLFLTQAGSAIHKTFGVKVTFRELMTDRTTPESVTRVVEERMGHLSVARAPQRAPRSPVQPEGIGPYRPTDTGASTETSARQKRELDTFIERYNARTRLSKHSTAAHRERLADPRTIAGFRTAWKEIIYPLVTVRSSGSKLWDIDGNEYIDLVNGFGTNLFGHAPEFVTAAISAQLHCGFEIGPQSTLAGPTAMLAAEMLGHQRVAFCNTGSEAVTAAVRLARTVTERDLIVMFAGAYHGINDEMLGRGTTVNGTLRSLPSAPGIPQSAVENVLVLGYGNTASLEVIRSRGPEIAAVLVEPIQSRRPDLQPITFLHDLRQVTRDSGTALIFDEVVTGFRVHPGGAQAVFDVKPDLATYGKVLGGGLPIGLLAGSAEYLDALDGGAWQYGDDSTPSVGMTFFAGTFVRHPLALAAAHAVLTHLKADGGELQRRLNLRTTAFVQTLNARAAELRAPVTVTHFSSWFCFNFAPDAPMSPLFFPYMRSKGIHIWEGRPGFLTTAHSEEDVARIIEAFVESLIEMQQAGFLPSCVDEPPVSGARRGKHPDGREGWFMPDPNRPGRYMEVSSGATTITAPEPRALLRS